MSLTSFLGIHANSFDLDQTLKNASLIRVTHCLLT